MPGAAQPKPKCEKYWTLPTDLNPLEAMLCYKQLWTVEQTFRTAKHLLSTRPIFHKLDETIRGHVFCSFLALVLKKALEDRVTALGRVGSWSNILADLDSLTEPRSSTTANASLSARHRVPPPAWRSVPPASRCHRQCATPRPTDDRVIGCVVPRCQSSVDCHCRSII